MIVSVRSLMIISLASLDTSGPFFPPPRPRRQGQEAPVINRADLSGFCGLFDFLLIPLFWNEFPSSLWKKGEVQAGRLGISLLDALLHTVQYIIVYLVWHRGSACIGSLPHPTETPSRPPSREQRRIPPTGNRKKETREEAAEAAGWLMSVALAMHMPG